MPIRGSRGSGDQPAETGRESARFQESAPRIGYLDGHRLRRVLLAAIEHVSLQRRELNRINVFPVPDGDTGTNLALTLKAVTDAIDPLRSESVSEVAAIAAQASVLGARGNSGMLLSHFLLGFARSMGRRVRVRTAEIAEAVSYASTSLRDVLEHPTEGTIITVADDLAAEGLRRASDRTDLYWWLRDVQEAARRSLSRTTEMLPALREAGVVDAGAKGFVGLFDGIVDYIDGRPPEPPPPVGSELQPILAALASAREAGFGSQEGRYCTQIAIRGDALPDETSLRQRLAGQGTSVIVLRTAEIAKVHIHTDDPDAVRALLAEAGEIISDRVEDTSTLVPARTVAVVTDSSSDLPAEWLEANRVAAVPMVVVVGDESYRDGIDLSGDQLAALLTNPAAPRITTSQPAPQAFAQAYQGALDAGAEEILGLFMSGSLSGTFGSAAAVMHDFDVPHEAVDSRTTSLGLGFLVERAVELLDVGATRAETVAELARVRAQSNLLFTVDTFEFLVRSGRVGWAKAWLGSRLHIKPVFTLNDQGAVVRKMIVRGRPALVPRVLQVLDEVLGDAKRYRLGVIHFGRPEFAESLAGRLRERYDAVQVLVRPVTATLSVHTGPEAWGVVFQIED